MLSRLARNHYPQLTQMSFFGFKRAHRSVSGTGAMADQLTSGDIAPTMVWHWMRVDVVDRTKEEQRRYQRVPFAGSVRVDGVSGQGLDVSMGGLRVKSVHPAPAIGSIVIVEFNLPGAGPIATRAEVNRVEDGIYILRFVRLDPYTMVSLAKFASSIGDADEGRQQR